MWAVSHLILDVIRSPVVRECFDLNLFGELLFLSLFYSICMSNATFLCHLTQFTTIQGVLYSRGVLNWMAMTSSLVYWKMYDRMSQLTTPNLNKKSTFGSVLVIFFMSKLIIFFYSTTRYLCIWCRPLSLEYIGVSHHSHALEVIT